MPWKRAPNCATGPRGRCFFIIPSARKKSAPGSISAVARRCGKPTCHCAKPGDPGQDPQRRSTSTGDCKNYVPICWRSTKGSAVRGQSGNSLGREAPRRKTPAAVHQEVTREIDTLLPRIFAERRKTGGLDVEAVELAFISVQMSTWWSPSSASTRTSSPWLARSRKAPWLSLTGASKPIHWRTHRLRVIAIPVRLTIRPRDDSTDRRSRLAGGAEIARRPTARARGWGGLRLGARGPHESAHRARHVIDDGDPLVEMLAAARG